LAGIQAWIAVASNGKRWRQSPHECRKAALTTPHRKFANALCDRFKGGKKNRPEADNHCDLPDMTFKRQWRMIFLLNKYAIRRGDAKSLKYLLQKI
jgi:transposase